MEGKEIKNCSGEMGTGRSNSTNADFMVHIDGSVALFIPLSAPARTWLEEHCPADGEHFYLGRSLVVGHRYLAGLIERAVDDGLRPMA
jgi:hypothetical protein